MSHPEDMATSEKSTRTNEEPMRTRGQAAPAPRSPSPCCDTAAPRDTITIREVTTDKKRYLDLLLLADEQESMIDRYLDRGTMFVLDDGGIKAECVLTDEGNGILEIKNIATDPAFQGRGYGRALIEFAAERYRGRFEILQIGTGDSPLTVPFYERCGFTRSHRLPGFFLENYDHPIFEAGVQLIDMVYLRRSL